jgi:hypothetical protein
MFFFKCTLSIDKSKHSYFEQHMPKGGTCLFLLLFWLLFFSTSTGWCVVEISCLTDSTIILMIRNVDCIILNNTNLFSIWFQLLLTAHKCLWSCLSWSTHVWSIHDVISGAEATSRHVYKWRHIRCIRDITREEFMTSCQINNNYHTRWQQCCGAPHVGKTVAYRAREHRTRLLIQDTISWSYTLLQTLAILLCPIKTKICTSPITITLSILRVVTWSMLIFTICA